MRSKLMLVLVMAAIMGLVASPVLAAGKLLCVSNKSLKGEQNVAQCVAKGERFAIVDDYGLVRILSPEEVELTKSFNPKVLETRAFGMQYHKEAPKMAPLVSDEMTK